MDTGNKFKNKQQKLFGHEQRKQNWMSKENRTGWIIVG